MKTAYVQLPSLSDILQYDDDKQNKRRHSLQISNLVSYCCVEDDVEPIKAKRKRASPSQLMILNKVFQQTFFPSTELRIELGKQLGMSPRTVQIWFQNKRQSIRSTSSSSSSSSSRNSITPPPPSLSYCKDYNNINLPPLRLSSSPQSDSPSITSILFCDPHV